MGMRHDTQLMGMKEICGYMELGERTVRRLIQEEGLPATKIGKEWMSDTGLIVLWRRERIKNAKGVRNGESVKG